MINIINEKLNTELNKSKTIYVLKGFNSIINSLNLECDHIFDTKVNKDLKNILSINDAEFLLNNMEKLKNDAKYWCLYEEMMYVEINNWIGIIKTCQYNIEIIDIGCFDYYYPGLSSENIQESIKMFDSETDDTNVIQKLYTSLELRNGEVIISYNRLDAENGVTYVNLFNTYSENYINYDVTEKKTVELYDNSQPNVFINIFNLAFKGIYNTIKYVAVEGKTDRYIKKFIYMLNLLGINIEISELENKYELPELYAEYLEILRRKNPTYSFKEINMYKDPFRSNEIIKVNQSIIINAIYENIIKAKNKESFKDIFVTAPTGAGKSILFQIPAIMAAEKHNLLTIVISPLIGLMKDQVNNIKVLTNCAETINSEYTPFEKEQIKEKIKTGECSMLYISPETLLSNSDITTFIGDREIGLLVIDEAHTVSTWGKNFRPDYWYLGEYLDKLRHTSNYIFPIATFTATATISDGYDDMYHDIVESLNMTCLTFIGDVKRNNIRFNINTCEVEKAYKEEKEALVIKKLNEYTKNADKTLVYFPFVKQLDDIYNVLPKEKVGIYHGKLYKSDKDETLEDVRNGKKNVVLATKAFGMGIDIPDIKNVYHFAPTGNLADYVQEIGRAARKPEMLGVASTDYYSDDFKYINKLYGISQITNYNIIGVLQKILYKYQNSGKRNFMMATDEFAHVFNANDDNEIEGQLKATIIAIKRDFKGTSNFVPLIFKPRSMFTKGLFLIPDDKMEMLEECGWDKYLKKKYSRNDLKNTNHLGMTVSYGGDIYELDFKKCWQEKYNGLKDGKTFGNFKRMFYEGELEDIDTSCFHARSILKVQTKYDMHLDHVLKRSIDWLDTLKDVLGDMKMSRKQYKIDEIVELIYSKRIEPNKTRIKNALEPMLNLLVTYDYELSNKRWRFMAYNSKTQRYNIITSYYERTIDSLKRAATNFIKGFENEKEREVIVDMTKKYDSKLRTDALLIVVQMMELFDAISYSFENGTSPEFFVRVNSETAIKKVVEDRNYSSKTLESIKNMHYTSVKYMKYFFEVLTEDEERWDFIENYFLGRVEEKYNVEEMQKGPKVNAIEKPVLNKNEIYVYDVFSIDDNERTKYYISKNKIEKLSEKDYNYLNVDSELAKNIVGAEIGKEININDYLYRVDNIEIAEK